MMAGANANILRYEDGTFTRMPTPGLAHHTVYGLWGSRPDDVYAVGSVAGRAGFVWHYDGAALARFLDYVQSKEKVWLARRIDIARHWHAHHSPG